MDINSSDPYVTLEIKGEKDSRVKTKTKENNLNPFWNETFDFNCKDRNTDTLLVNLFDKDIKNDDKMMNELSYPLSNWPIGSHIDVVDDIKLKKKDAGKLYLGIDVYDLNSQPVVQSRDIQLEQPPEQPSVEYCDFTLGNYPSDYSTYFTGFSNLSSLSEIHSWEEKRKRRIKL